MDERRAQRRRDRFRRARWRLRGALLWPTFAAATVADAAIMHWLPIAGEGTHWVPALLLAGSLNVAAVALLGGLGGFVTRRLRPSLPKVVADDRAGTAVLAALAATFLAAGLVHAPELDARRDAFSAQSLAVRRWIDANGDSFARAHVDRADSLRLEQNLYRTCVPSEPLRYLCVIVDTSASPPRIKRDASRESNATFNGGRGFR